MKVVHHAGSNLDYSCNWFPDRDPWLEVGETISTSSWVVTGDDAALIKGTSTKDNTSTTVWVSGGTVGADYVLTNTIVTSASRTDSRSITLACLAP